MRSVDNIFSNSVKFLRDLGPSLVEAGKKSKIPEYIQKGVETAADNATKFGGDVYQNLKDGTYTTRYGNQTYSGGTPFSSAAGTVLSLIHI